MLSRLPTRCKHCKVKFAAEERGKRLHPDCIEPWTAAFQEKQQQKAIRERKAKQRVEKAQDRKKRADQKRIPDLIKEAQTAFNAFIRERDRGQPCICCGQPLGTGSVGGAFDCGHYRSVGSASHLRFDIRNAHAQRKQCNRYGAGRAVDYRIGLIARIGLSAVEALEASNTPHKWERDELIAIRALYVGKLKELKKGQA
jgi:hypothetical protein